jgi:hypothetical protein
MSKGHSPVNFISNEQGLRDAVESAPLDTPLIVDFDHTLLLSCSTEEYLNSIRPRWLGALVLTGMDFLKPWRIFGSENRDFIYKDHCRVLIATLLFPWVVLIWKRRAASIGAQFKNEALINILKTNANQRIVLVSYGYSFIIRPLLESYPMSFSKVLGAKFLKGYLMRKQGKLGVIKNAEGEDILSRSIFITDSLDDKPVLIEARYPVLIEWPLDKRFTAFRDVYVPFYYTEKVKWPGHRPVLKNFVLDDIPALLLSITFVNGFSASSIAATLLFFTAFICMYELGYRENDFIAPAKEENPALSKNLEEYRSYSMGIQAWVWSIVLSIAGLIFLNLEKFKAGEGDIYEPLVYEMTETLLIWLGFLVLVRTVFRVHNSIKVNWRIFSHGLLQFLRMFGYVLVMPTNIIGAFYLGTIAMSRWMSYSIYRANGDRSSFPDKVVRLTLFVLILVVVVMINRDFTLLTSLQVWLVFFWCLVRGSHQILLPLRKS